MGIGRDPDDWADVVGVERQVIYSRVGGAPMSGSAGPLW